MTVNYDGRMGRRILHAKSAPDFSRSHDVSKVTIPSVWDVPPEFRARLGERVGRQRAMYHAGHLLVVLHQPPRPGEDLRRPAMFWRDPQGNWLSTEAGSGLGSFQKFLDQYEVEIDQLESAETAASGSEEYFQVLDVIAPLQRSIRNCHAVLQESRRLVEADRNLINLRDRAYDLERRAELLYSAATNGLEFAVARRAEEQTAAAQRMAVASHRLNLLAAFFFPIATLSAVFGVNLKFGWEEAPAPVPFLVVMAVGLVMGAGLAMFVVPRGGAK